MNITIEAYRNKFMTTEAPMSTISPEISSVVEKLAAANHEGWMKGKLAAGYSYGPVVNDDPANGPKTSPLLVPYDQLSEEDKASNVANVEAVVDILSRKGVTFVNFESLLYAIAEEIHDAWARQKFAAGWQWAEVTDKANKVHRDLRPFQDLLDDPNLIEDVAYDVSTARDVLIMMIRDCNIFPVVPASLF